MTLRFDLPAATHVELTVLNLTGQPAATLLSGWCESGSRLLRWDGRGDDGRELASGVYSYRLSTGHGKQVLSRRLVLVR